METEILNAKITSTSITMAEHGVLTFWVTVQGGGWGCSIGGYVIGNGYLDADNDFFKGSGSGLEAMMRIMDTVGVDKWEDLEGKYVRCVLNDGWGGTITKIGNITKDKWFDLKEFFAKVQQETDRKEKTVKKGNEPHEYNNAKVNHFFAGDVFRDVIENTYFMTLEKSYKDRQYIQVVQFDKEKTPGYEYRVTNKDKNYIFDTCELVRHIDFGNEDYLFKGEK